MYLILHFQYLLHVKVSLIVSTPSCAFHQITPSAKICEEFLLSVLKRLGYFDMTVVCPPLYVSTNK